MRIAFMGTPAHSIPVLEVLLSLDSSEVVGVYTQPDKPGGRGRVREPSPVKEFALGHGIRVFDPPSLRQAEVQREVASLSPDLIVVASYGKILPPEVLDIPSYGCLNIHPSLLPKYRGPSPVATAIMEGDGFTGATIMVMDEGMDTGPVLARSNIVPIHARVTTTESITPRLFRLGGELLKEVLPLWLRGEITPQPQDHREATVTRKLEKKDGEVNWELTATVLERHLRAFTPWPGLFTYWKGKLLKILSAATFLHPPGLGISGDRDQFGLVVPLDEPGIPAGVVTAWGVLGLKRVQVEGKRSITCEELLRGYGDFLGAKLPS